MGHPVVCREAATQDAGAEAPPHVTILHAGHLGKVTQVEGNAVGRLLENGGVYAGPSRLRGKGTFSTFLLRNALLLQQA